MTTQHYVSLLNEIDTIADRNRLEDYHAFVYWFLETNFEWMDKQKILNSICDGTHDKGIDAIIINDIESKVVILQSKFEREGAKTQIKESDVKLLASVKNYFKHRRALEPIVSNANPSASRLLRGAFEAIRNKGYSLELILITTHRNAPQISNLIRETLGFKPGEFSVFSYGEIIQLFTDRLRGFTPSLGVYHLPYRDSDKSLIKQGKFRSWVLTVSLEEIRNMVNRFGDNLFKKNVRNFLGDNLCNRGIRETLESNPDMFWYYNNGICILCDEGNIVPEEGYIRLVNPQIINGCQTVRSIEKFQGDLSGDLLVRIVESREHEFVNLITLYQNTSNPVKKRDLKSNDPIQVRLKNEFKMQHWYYETKRGEEFKKMSKKYRWMKTYFRFTNFSDYKVINNENVAKLLVAIKLSPDIAVAKGSEDFFDKYYNQIFTPQISTSNCIAPFILYNFMIKNTYSMKRRFHEFKKEYIFKNPASFFILRFIYDALSKQNNFEKKLIEFYENASEREYNSLFRTLKKIISKYFELIYKSWKRKKTEYPDHRSYLQSSQTFKEIRKNYSRQIVRLSKQTNTAFKRVF